MIGFIGYLSQNLHTTIMSVLPLDTPPPSWSTVSTHLISPPKTSWFPLNWHLILQIRWSTSEMKSLPHWSTCLPRWRAYDQYQMNVIDYHMGDLVWLKATNIPSNWPNKKLDHWWVRLYMIDSMVGASSYSLHTPGHYLCTLSSMRAF